MYTSAMEGYELNFITAGVGTGRSHYISRLSHNIRAKRHNDRRFVYHGGKSSIIIDWCHKNFGNVKRNMWGYSKSYGTIYITDKELAVAFKLRWM